MFLRDTVWLAAKKDPKPAPSAAQQKPKLNPGLKVRSGIRIGGIDPGGNHSRNLLGAR